jgi:hypothetical protein
LKLPHLHYWKMSADKTASARWDGLSDEQHARWTTVLGT